MSYKHREDYRNDQKCESVMTPDLIWLTRTKLRETIILTFWHINFSCSKRINLEEKLNEKANNHLKHNTYNAYCLFYRPSKTSPLREM